MLLTFLTGNFAFSIFLLYLFTPCQSFCILPTYVGNVLSFFITIFNIVYIYHLADAFIQSGLEMSSVTTL